MGGGRVDAAALLYSLMADEQDNQTKQIRFSSFLKKKKKVK